MIYVLLVVSIPIMSLITGMFFGRNAPHKPEYDKL